MAYKSKNLTFDITSGNGFVVVDHPEIRIELTPEDARRFADSMLKHADAAALVRDAKVRRTAGGH